MTILIFLVDTSASMNQRTYLGTTLLDVAKCAVEMFMKIRSRDSNSRLDRYMLLTFEEPPTNVKAGWKESHATFIRELKNLQAIGLTTLGPALKNTFDLLNINRMQSGIDTYGQGRSPFFLEPAIIICITDGRRMTSPGGVQLELNLPMNNAVPGTELTKEPFRWDQRLFGLALRIPATPPPPESQNIYIPSADDSPLDAMCDVTGGRSYQISSQRMLMQCLESLAQKCQSGVVINFEKMGPDPPPIADDDKNGDDKRRVQTPTFQSSAWQNCRKMVYIQRSAQKGFFGHWPIPEGFWPDLNSPTLVGETIPPRSAHPVVRFSCTPCEPMVIENLPFDKYELEPSPLTQYILERRQPNIAWQVFVSNSAKYSDIGHAFGYLKASSNLSAVNLFVMPYNFPVLLPLLDELFKVHKLKPTQKWRQQFDNYLKTMPVYYAAPLRRALARLGAQNLVPDNMDSCLSYSVISYLKKMKNQAKIEYDRLVASVGSKAPMCEGIKVTSRSATSILQRKDFKQLLKNSGGNMSLLKQEMTDYNTFSIAAPDVDLKPQTYKNPFDIPRKNLLDQLARMRINFTHPTTVGTKLQDEENLHSIPVQDMGNYQEYLKRMPPPLREMETTPVRQHTFGNPFKVNKNLMIDEADEAMPGQHPSKKRTSSDTPPSSPRPNKRKPGPLPRDVPARRLMSPAREPSQDDLVIDLTSLPGPPKDFTLDDDIVTPNGEYNAEFNHLGGDLEIELMNHFGESSSSENEDEDSNGNRIIATANQNGGRRRLSSAEKQAIISSATVKQNNIKDHNTKLRIAAIKEVKKPGKSYESLFTHLGTIQGTLDTKCLFVRDIKREAERFKKHTLASMLEQFEESLLKLDTKRKVATNNHINQKPPSR